MTYLGSNCATIYKELYASDGIGQEAASTLKLTYKNV